MKAFAGKSPWVLLKRAGILAVILIAASLRLRATTEMPPPIGGLMIERTGHTATRLPDGKVLFVGGKNAAGTVRDSEVFNPSTRAFTVTAGLLTARADHTATLLPDGRLLVIGGRASDQLLDSTEVYDPATNVFAAGPMLARARAGHTATLLPDGRIVVIGGDADGSIEILDPEAGTFGVIEARLSAPRSLHAAAFLKSGEILIAGGVGSDGTVLDSAELLDTATMTFLATSPQMHIARTQPTLRVLPDGKVQLIGGDRDATMELFNPDGRYFSSLVHPTANPDLLSAALKTQTRAAALGHPMPLKLRGLYSAQIADGTDELLDRTGYSLTELPGLHQALVAGGSKTTGQLKTSAALLISSDATVTTDQTDYSPGQTVTITGTGWMPGETVSLNLHRDTNTPPDTVVTAIADENGNILNAEYVCTQDDFGQAFLLTAIGQTSGYTAQTSFTDGGPKINKLFKNAGLTIEGYQFAAGVGDTIYVQTAALIVGHGYKLEVKSPSGTSLHLSPCIAATSATSVTDSYTLTGSDGPSGTNDYTWVLHEWTSGTCASGPLAEDADNTMAFDVAQVTAYTSPPPSTTTTTYGAGQTAFVRVAGLSQSVKDWNATWVAPGVACANTGGGDRPASATDGSLPTTTQDGFVVSASTYLQYPPTTGDSWNTLANYESSTCPAFATTNTGSWQLTLTNPAVATQSVTLTVFSVTAGGAADHLAFVQQPTNTPIYTAISPPVTVEMQDVNGYRATGSSAAVTVALGANPGGSTLSGTLTQSAVNGLATFSDLTLDNAANGYTLTAASSGLGGAISSSFNVTPVANTWTGAVDTNWKVGANWSDGLVPATSATALIPGGRPNYPVIQTGGTATPVTIGSIQINTVRSGASVGVASGGSLTVSGAAGITINGSGTFNVTGGTATIAGAVTVTSGGTLNVSGGTVLESGTLTVNSGANANVSGTGHIHMASTVGATPTDNIVVAGTLTQTGGQIEENALSISAGAAVTESGGTNSESGAFTNAAGSTLTINGGTLDMTPTTADKNNINNNGTINISAGSLRTHDYKGPGPTMTGGTLGIAHDFDPDSFSASGGTVEWTFATAETAGGGAFKTASPPTYTFFNVLIDASASPGFDNNNPVTLNVAGNWTNKSAATSLTTKATTVIFNGSAPQTIGGTGTVETTFQNLTVNNAAGITLSTSDETVAATLTFTNGNITTGSNTLTSGSSATTGTVTPTGGYVVGSLQKFINNNAAQSTKTFEIGTASFYTPLTFTPLANPTGTNATSAITATSVAGEHASVSTSGINQFRDVNSYWSLTSTGAGSIPTQGYTVLATFPAGDIDGGANTNNFIIKRFFSPTWNATTAPSRTGTSTQATVTFGAAQTLASGSAFGAFVVGESTGGATTTTEVSSNNPSTFGDPVTFTATVTSGGSPVTEGSVTFRDGGTDCSSGTIVQAATAVDVNGQVTYTTSTLTPPSHTIRACYNDAPSTNFAASSGSVLQTVNKANQTITVTTPAPATAVYNTTFNVAATASSGLPVAITSSGSCSGSGSGSATITMTSGTGTCTVNYDQAGNGNYNPAPQVSSSTTAQKASQTITVTTPAPATAVYNTTFNVAATASSGLPVAITSSGSCSGGGSGSATITMTSGTGTCTVNYDQAGNANYSAAPQVSSNTTAQKASQTITVTTPAPATAIYNTTFNVAATASSGLPVAITSSGACSGSGSGSATITMTSGTGTCTVNYNQAGDTNYSAAPQVSNNTTAQKASQTITVTTPAPATAIYNTTFNVAATASSGLPVAITSSGACSGSGSGSATITMTSGTGTCTVDYNQAGDTNYSAAPQVSSNTTAQLASQTITVTTPAPATAVFNTSFNVAATASSGLPVAITSSGSCSGSGSGSATITMTSGTGTCTVDYNQAGNTNYSAAPQVSSSTTAQKANQTITFTGAPASAVYGTSFVVTGTASSGLAVTFGASGACSISGTTVTMTSGVGTCNLTADQAGNGNYNAAPQATQSTTAVKATATVTLSNLSQTYDTTPKSATVTTNPSGLTVTVTYDGSPTAPTNVGSYAVVATVIDNNYQGSASGTLTINPGPPAKLVFTTGPQTLTAGDLSSTITVQTQDQYGNASNVASDLTVNLHTTSGGGLFRDTTDTNTITFVTILTGTSSASFKYKDTVAGSPDIKAFDEAGYTDPDTGLIDATQTETINPGAATHYSVSAPGSTNAGSAFNVTVTALDQFNNTDTSYVGTAHFTSSDGLATLPSDYTFTSGLGMDNGVHTFTNGATLKTAGTRTITATDTVTSTITGTSGNITVTGAALDHITIAPASATIAAGGSQAYTAEGFDQFNNDLGDVTSSTTFSITPNGSCTLASCTATVAGSHTVTGDDSGKTANASLSVTPAALDHLVLSPASATVAAGASQSYTAEGFDQYGNSRGDVTAVTTFSITPNGSCTLASCTATVAGSHTVTGTDSGKTGTASLTVTAAALDHLVLSPASATITAGGSQSYTAEGFDQYGNSRGDVTGATTFSIAPNGSCTLASCTASVAGAHTVTGTDSGKTGTASLTVNAGALDHLVLAPASSTITAGGSQSYTAEGQDQYNNTLGDVTASTVFTISPNGSCTGASCTATVAGAHTVTGTDSGKTGTASLTVNAAALDHLVLAPASATITAGGSQAYTAEGFDQYNNDLGDMTSTTTFTIAPNGSCTGASCTATVAGSHTVTGTKSGKTGTASLTVNAAALDHLVLAPASATITAGGSQAYTAEGFDQYNNDLGDMTSTTTFTIASNGSCTGASCTATVAGSHTVTGTKSGKTGTASLTVNAAAMDHLVLAPASATITAGGSQTYTAEGFDQYNNDLGDVTGSTTFTIAPDGFCTGASCTATVAGSHLVTGTDIVSGKTGTASLTVNPSGLDHITISPSSATITAGGSQSYTAQGFDSSNNSLGDVTASTTFSIAPDGACTGASCTATVAGSHAVTGNDSGKTATASLTVNAAALDHLTLAPASASIPQGGSQSYTATGFDQYNNSKGDVTAFTTFTISPDGSCTANSCGSSVAGPHTVTGTDSGKTGTASLTVNDTTAPDTTISTGPSASTSSTSATFTFTGSDNVTPAGSLTFQCQLDGGGYSACASPKTYTGLALGPHTFQVRATDAAGNTDPTPSSYPWTVVTGDTTPPVTSNTMVNPNPAPVSTTTYTLTATIKDSESNVTAAQYKIDSGPYVTITSSSPAYGSSQTVNVTATFGAQVVGVHNVCVRGTDSAGNTAGTNTGEECILLAVYDAKAGFVTGGGWINSPPGAYVPDASLVGKANFGFISQYQNGKTIPTGNTEFQFQTGNINFKSTSYDWLVISGGYKAQYKGYGTINGSGNYSFILTGIDGTQTGSGGQDKFRIKIYDQNQGNAVIYDNNLNNPDTADPATLLGGGNIVIHK